MITHEYEKYLRNSISSPWELYGEGSIEIGVQDGIRFVDHIVGESNAVTAILTAREVDRIQRQTNSIDGMFTRFVSKGRANVTSTQANWLNIAAVPGYSTSERYFCFLNCTSTPLMGYVRNDGRLIAYGPAVTSGTTYQIDYVLFVSQEEE